MLFVSHLFSLDRDTSGDILVDPIALVLQASSFSRRSDSMRLNSCSLVFSSGAASDSLSRISARQWGQLMIGS
jgi:hypothetical protein